MTVPLSRPAPAPKNCDVSAESPRALPPVPRETVDIDPYLPPPQQERQKEPGSSKGQRSWFSGSGSVWCGSCQDASNELRFRHDCEAPTLISRRRPAPEACCGGKWEETADLSEATETMAHSFNDGGAHLNGPVEVPPQELENHTPAQRDCPSRLHEIFPSSAAHGARTTVIKTDWQRDHAGMEDEVDATDGEGHAEVGSEEETGEEEGDVASPSCIRIEACFGDRPGHDAYECVGSDAATSEGLGQSRCVHPEGPEPSFQDTAERVRYEAAEPPPAGSERSAPSASSSWARRAVMITVSCVSAGAFATAAGGALPVTVAAGSVGFTLGLLSSILGIRVGRWVS